MGKLRRRAGRKEIIAYVSDDDGNKYEMESKGKGLKKQHTEKNTQE
jgi:hypothetical protein